MVVASEVGVMDFEPGNIKEKGRLQPGKILLIDTEKGEIYYDGEQKKQLAEAKPYRRIRCPPAPRLRKPTRCSGCARRCPPLRYSLCSRSAPANSSLR